MRRLFLNVSIKHKVVLIVMLASSVGLFLAGAGVIIYERMTFHHNVVESVSNDATLVASANAGAIAFDRPDEAYEALRSAFRSRPHLIAAAFYSGDGVFTNYPADAAARGMVPASGEMFTHWFEADHLGLFRPTVYRGQTNGAIFLKSDLLEVNTRLKRYGNIVVLVMIASFLVSLFLSSRLQRVISEPVLHLADTARTVSEKKNYSIRATKHGDDELGQLIDGFNSMLGQIQHRDAELQNARDELEIRVHDRTRQLEQQLTRISLLNQITYSIAARQDLDSIVLIVLQQLEDQLPVDYGAAYLLDSQTGMLTAMVRGPKSRPVAEKLELAETISMAQTPFQGCLTGEMVYVPDCSAVEPRVGRAVEAGLRSFLAVPLIVEQRVFGLLVLARRRLDAFSVAEREFIHGLSAHMALAVHQARLYQDLHKAYDDLRQTQHAVMQQQRLQALGQMASGIAHDINNSLSPIVAYSELLARIEPNLSDKSKKVLNHIKTAGDDIAHIVARMREFYRHRDELEEFVSIELNQLIEQVGEMTRPRWRNMPQSGGTAIELKTVLAANLPPLNGNASEVREALTNLILNAVDALPEGGTITIRTRLDAWGKEGDRQKHEHIILEVSDDGIGMNEETRRRCLEPFFSTKGKRGTGLGLAMVYGVMERHDGTVDIESKPGKGTTMRLIFPAGEAIPQRRRKQSEAATEVPPLRILCIDDEPLLRDVMKQLLEEDGHRVHIADGGQSGVEAFRAALAGQEPFQVVITDLGMPNLNGRQVAQIVKRESPRTPVIMLTGWGALMKVQGDVPAQVDGVLSKPPRIGELRERLSKCIARVDLTDGKGRGRRS